jgi:hypothetical protein
MVSGQVMLNNSTMAPHKIAGMCNHITFGHLIDKNPPNITNRIKIK